MKTYVVFSKLDFNGLGVRADWSLSVQGGVCVVQPGLQLRQGMLELTQGQQGSLQFVLRWRKDRGFRLKNRSSDIWAIMKNSCQIHTSLQKEDRHRKVSLKFSCSVQKNLS